LSRRRARSMDPAPSALHNGSTTKHYRDRPSDLSRNLLLPNTDSTKRGESARLARRARMVLCRCRDKRTRVESMSAGKTRLCIVTPHQQAGGAEYQIACLIDVLAQ